MRQEIRVGLTRLHAIHSKIYMNSFMVRADGDNYLITKTNRRRNQYLFSRQTLRRNRNGINIRWI